MPNPKPKKRIIIFFIGALLMTLLLSCEKPAPPPAEPLEVVVELSKEKDFPIYSIFIGTTEASLDVQVRARVDGFIEELTFTEGSLVKERQLLYRIDNRPYKTRAKRLQANSESAHRSIA